MLFALWQIQIAGTQRIFHRESKTHFPNIAIDVAGLIFKAATQLAGNERSRCILRQFFQIAVIQLPDELDGFYQWPRTFRHFKR